MKVCPRRQSNGQWDRVFGQDFLDGFGGEELFLEFFGGERIEGALLGVAEVTQGFGRAAETAIRRQHEPRARAEGILWLYNRAMQAKIDGLLSEETLDHRHNALDLHAGQFKENRDVFLAVAQRIAMPHGRLELRLVLT